MITAAVLAAGRSRRLGRDKALLELGRDPLVRRALRTAVAAGIDDRVVIVNAENGTAIQHAVDGLGVRVVVNPRAADGLGTSIAAAAAAVPPARAALLLLQVDQAFVDEDMLAALVDAWRTDRPVFVASRYDGLTTTPVVFDRRLFAELGALAGDRGARRILQRHEADGRVLAFPAWRGTDIDSAEDWERARTME